MAVNLTSADKALKSFYLDVVTEQLNNNVNPFLARIKQSTNDVWGKEVRKLAIYGVNGGIGAGTEDGNLPASSSNSYEQFVATLKNLYGTIEISDKAVRASENNSGAFVNLLNAEMEGLVKASTFNFGRMLFGDGSGKLCDIIEAEGNVVTVEHTYNLIEGMVCDIYFYMDLNNVTEAGRKILKIDRVNNKVTLSGPSLDPSRVMGGSLLVVQNSCNKELTGLKAIFDDEIKTLYGLNKEENPWLKPFVMKSAGEISEIKLQTALDTIEQNSGSACNFIICSWGVRRALQKLFSATRSNIDVMNLEGGFKAISYNGIPIVADRFCPEGTMYLLNTDDFTLHQLCDWQWLSGDDGKILKQVPGKPVYTATLVKYAELLCSRPNGQGMISGITEA